MPTMRGRAGADGATDSTELVDLFLELASIPSPPGEERGVADVVRRYLRDLGLAPDEDEHGNIYARISPTADGTPLFFCAHMDTVPPEGRLEPVLEDGVIRNAGGTILGADDKSAIVAMLDGARRALAESRPQAHGVRSRTRRAYQNVHPIVPIVARPESPFFMSAVVTSASRSIARSAASIMSWPLMPEPPDWMSWENS